MPRAGPQFQTARSAAKTEDWVRLLERPASACESRAARSTMPSPPSNFPRKKGTHLWRRGTRLKSTSDSLQPAKAFASARATCHRVPEWRLRTYNPCLMPYQLQALQLHARRRAPRLSNKRLDHSPATAAIHRSSSALQSDRDWPRLFRLAKLRPIRDPSIGMRHLQ